MKRWFTWRQDPPPVPSAAAKSEDAAARRALDDLNSAVPRPALFQPRTVPGIEVHEGIGVTVVATTVAPALRIYCGNSACRRRHVEPLAEYADTASYVCARCGSVNVKQPLRSLLGRIPSDNIAGQLAKPRRKPSDKMS